MDRTEVDYLLDWQFSGLAAELNWIHALFCHWFFLNSGPILSLLDDVVQVYTPSHLNNWVTHWCAINDKNKADFSRNFHFIVGGVEEIRPSF